MTVDSATAIAYVVFWETTNGTVFWDNLSYEIRASSVPEPASLALVGFAFAALGIARRRKMSPS